VEDDVLASRREEQWWNKLVKEEHKEDLELGGKLVLLFDIVNMSQHLGDKV